MGSVLRTCPCNFMVLLTVQTIFIRNCTVHCRTFQAFLTQSKCWLLCSNKVVSGNTAPNTHDRETQATSTRKHTCEGFKLTAEAFVHEIERGEVRFIWVNRFVSVNWKRFTGSTSSIKSSLSCSSSEDVRSSKAFTLTMWHLMFACWYNNNFIMWQQKALYFSLS